MSAVFWIQCGVPSMPIMLYVGLSAAAASVTLAFVPLNDNMIVFDIMKWFCTILGYLGLFALTLLHLSHHGRESPVTWGLNVSGLSSFVGLVFVTEIFSNGSDAVVSWLLFTIFTVLPLMFFGVVTTRMLLLFLGALGSLFDVYWISHLLTETLLDGIVPAPLVQFLFLGAVGIGVGALGFFVQHRQERVQAWVEGWSDGLLGSWKKDAYT